jgi:hypothetical protein
MSLSLWTVSFCTFEDQNPKNNYFDRLKFHRKVKNQGQIQENV